jgi:NADH dehydrogenase
VKSILITGSSGFVGTDLIKRIDPRKYENVYCLGRTEGKGPAALSDQAHFKFIRCSLFEVGLYERQLAGTDIVIHLAAATGKARPDEYFKVNVEGTRLLVGLCQRLGVQRFLHVSSIAVRFPDKRRYYYAQSKEEAEEVVRSSGLRYTIIRPTIILGPGAPLWMSLSKLAQLPVVPIFGDGKTLIQPIHVDDLVDFILAILDRDIFQGETFELGGQQVIAIEDLLKKIHLFRYHTEPRTVHIPLALLIPLLTLLERLLYPLMPVTVGQLSSFRYNGTIEKNRLFEERVSHLKTIDEILAPLCSHDAC